MKNNNKVTSESSSAPTEVIANQLTGFYVTGNIGR